MKVFIFTCNKQYGGGMAVVAATNMEEAFEVLKTEYGGDEFIYEYTDLKHCYQSEELTTNVTKAQVLEYDFYVD